MQLIELGWSILFTNFIVWDLRDKKPVPRSWRVVAWGTFRESLNLPQHANAHCTWATVSSITTPFILPAPRSIPYGRLLSFFLGFGVCFVWLAIGSEGLFYIAYSLTLCLWVEVETALRAHKHAKEKPIRAERRDVARTYRLHADDLRIAVFFLFFVQVAFFGTGK